MKEWIESEWLVFVQLNAVHTFTMHENAIMISYKFMQLNLTDWSNNRRWTNCTIKRISAHNKKDVCYSLIGIAVSSEFYGGRIASK